MSSAANSPNYSIRMIRLARRMGLRELAMRACVSQTELRRCERGLVLPTAEFFAAIATVLAVSPTELQTAHTLMLGAAITGEGYMTATPEESYVITPPVLPSNSAISVLDLFCGTGGFSHGFTQTAQFQVTAGLDLLSDRVQTFSVNHPTATVFCGDIRELPISTVAEAAKQPQVIIGGPPCQGFSSLRPFRTLTEGDPRNNLVEHFAVFVAALRPQWFVIENVVGLLTHKQGRILRDIVEHFESIGYHTEWRVLNAALYGLPQRRERLIIVGNRLAKRFHWPNPTHYFAGRSMAGSRYGQVNEQLPLFGASLPPALSVMDAIHDLPAIQAGEVCAVYREDIVPTEYERTLRGGETILTLHDATKHTPHMLEIIEKAGSNRNALPPGLTSSGFSSSYSRLDPDRPSVTLTVNFVHPGSNKCIHPLQNRGLTPREGARLQGFADSYQFLGKRSEIVKQIGNAVPPVLGKIIAEAILQQL